MRIVVAVIGSAGSLEPTLRKEVELLSGLLTAHQFDLVTGGRCGVMRAVARGHHLSGAKTNLIHIDPGWDDPLGANPYDASVVRTGLGSMRNHLVVRAADIVVAVGGGAGTLSEISLAWQEHKPLLSLDSVGGWGQKLSGVALDGRRKDTVIGFSTAKELVDHVVAMRPAGVFGGRRNRGFFPDVVPALHRIHTGSPDGSFRIHQKYGMSIAKHALISRLKELDARVKRERPDTRALVSFDDGWSDVLDLVPTFRDLTHLQPVLFVGENHYASPLRPLPLQRWYAHCSTTGDEVEPVRQEIKLLSEESAHEHLDSLGVQQMLNPDWLLTPEDLEGLSAEGWIVGSHGHAHEDLRSRRGLISELRAVGDDVEQRNQMPWFCWPEGQWSMKSYDSARAAGFMLQFGLKEEQHPEEHPDGLVLRTIWR